jgi:hypothetical protein
MTAPTPLLRLPRKQVMLWMPTSQWELKRPRAFRVGPWLLCEDCDRTINVADQSVIDLLNGWDPPIKARVLTGDPLPRPFDRLTQKAADGSHEWLTYDGLLAGIERDVRDWTEIYGLYGILEPGRSALTTARTRVAEAALPKPRPKRKYPYRKPNRPVITVAQAAWEGMKLLGEIESDGAGGCHSAMCAVVLWPEEAKDCNCVARKIGRTWQRIADALAADKAAEEAAAETTAAATNTP